jgi:hypothetical protein
MTRRPRPARRDSDNEYKLRDRRLRALGHVGGDLGYSEYLRSPAWDRARDRLARAARQECFVCWRSSCQVHHCRYRNLGHERSIDLVWLCDRHHKAVHTLVEIFDHPLADAHVAERQHYFGNCIRERADDLRMRIQAAVDAGRFRPATGALEAGPMLFKIDAEAHRVRLRFRTVHDYAIAIAITFPNGTEAQLWELRPDPTVVPQIGSTAEL